MLVFQYNLHWMVGSVLRNLQAASELANEKAKMNEWGADTFTSSALLESKMLYGAPLTGSICG